MKAQGKHPHQALTATAIRNQSIIGRYADGNGLYLVVDKSGNKRWLLRITVRKKRRDIGLGGWPSVSLADARRETEHMKNVARKGGDPLAQRRKQNIHSPIFRDAADIVHKEHSASWRNKKHAAQWIKTLETYAFPYLGHLPVNEIGTAEVKAALTPIWLTKPETARRVRQRIGTVLDWAKASGHRTGENPIRSVTKGLPQQSKSERHHASLPYAELPSFLVTLRESDADQNVRLAFEFLILTATRTSEVINATWDEINMESAEWVIPASRMKAGKVFRVPLSDRAVEILAQAKELTGDRGYIFSGRKSGEPLSQMAFLMLLRRMGTSITAHGFRSTFRDWAAERTNFPREICEAALAHSLKDKTEAAYLRTDQFDKRRKLMTTWANFATTPSRAPVLNLKAGT